MRLLMGSIGDWDKLLKQAYKYVPHVLSVYLPPRPDAKLRRDAATSRPAAG